MDDTQTTTQSNGFNIFLGIVLVIIGLIVLSAQLITSLLSIYFLGFMLALGGVTQFFYGFFSGSLGRALVFFLGGIFNFVVGVILIYNPALSAVTLALVISILLLVSGIYKMVASIMGHYSKWGWTFFSGAISLVLGVAVLQSWPASGLWIIGLFIGIELLVSGFLLMFQTSEIAAGSSSNVPYYSGTKGGKSKGKDTNKDEK